MFRDHGRYTLLKSGLVLFLDDYEPYHDDDYSFTCCSTVQVFGFRQYYRRLDNYHYCGSRFLVRSCYGVPRVDPKMMSEII